MDLSLVASKSNILLGNSFCWFDQGMQHAGYLLAFIDPFQALFFFSRFGFYTYVNLGSNFPR